MSDILTEILQYKKEELKHIKNIRSSFSGGRTDSNRGFAESLSIKPNLSLIAEIKKASPSKGLIREDFNPIKIAQSYERGMASAISVLTDEKFFLGNIEYLKDARSNTSIPILRKDFIIDVIQVEQTAHINADGMLLIVSALGDGQINELYHASREMGIDPLVEIHNGKELDRAMLLEPNLIGINNRNLSTFDTSIKNTMDIIKHIPNNVTVISESGIFTGEDTQILMSSGVSGVLVGESLMREDSPEELIKELRHI